MTVEVVPKVSAMHDCPFCRLAGPVRLPGSRASGEDLFNMAPLAAPDIGRGAP